RASGASSATTALTLRAADTDRTSPSTADRCILAVPAERHKHTRPSPVGSCETCPRPEDRTMCRNITTLRGLEPPATGEEIEAAARAAPPRRPRRPPPPPPPPVRPQGQRRHPPDPGHRGRLRAGGRHRRPGHGRGPEGVAPAPPTAQGRPAAAPSRGAGPPGRTLPMEEPRAAAPGPGAPP